MIRIDQFPDDDSFWLIKWIDGFRIPHCSTTSASVSILLQKLPFQEQSQINKLSSQDVANILGKSYKDNDVQFLRPEPRVLVGMLPVLNIGAIFHKKDLVGYLPTSSSILSLQNVEDSCREISLDQELAKPINWTYPYRLLNRFEYIGINHKFERSRCLLHTVGNTDMIIPRSVIFTFFYTPHREMARAFTNGHWEKQLKTLICTEGLESGLKTQVSEDGEWQIILKTKILTGFYIHLALFYFDEYARSCANSIYSNALKDRGASSNSCWYASAKIPFKPSSRPLTLRVRGFYLKTLPPKFSTKVKKKFLVTRIINSSLPEYLPAIAYERLNSGETGSDIKLVNESAPYGATRKSRIWNGDSILDSTHDASLSQGVTLLQHGDVGWTNLPPTRKLVKGSSKRYQKERGIPISEISGDKLSVGNESYQSNNLPSAETKALNRKLEAKFESLLVVFDQLKSTGRIVKSSTLGPAEPLQLSLRSGLTCWNFLSEEQRQLGKWPTRSWRLIEPAMKSDEGHISRPGVPRSALVIKVDLGQYVATWIEIECKKQEGYLSPFLLGSNSDDPEVIAHCLEIIAENKGVKLKKKLTAGLSGYFFGEVYCYRHCYESKESTSFKKDSVDRFLRSFV